MDALTNDELRHFAKLLAERKQRLVDEIRRVLARSSKEHYAEILAGGGDAAGRYGICIDCGRPVGRQRLAAYPTAKRCIEDQQRREKTRASAPHSRL